MPLKPATVRVLVVDDFASWRAYVRSLLQARPEWKIAGEVEDGREAVRKAAELKPDVILLDIGLPHLNGIEAAREIYRVAPGAKVIFVTQNSDASVARAALSDGASGYVLKGYVETELLLALNVVLHGGRFVSEALGIGH